MKRRFIALAGPAALGALMASSSPLALAQDPGTGDQAAQPAAAAPVAEAPKPVANGNVVVRIQVAGTRRIEESTIRQYLPFAEGDRYSDALGDTALKALTATGLFADVTIRESGGVVQIEVIENPVINSVNYEGNSRLDDDDLSKESQLAPRQILSRPKVQSDIQRIQELYRRAGRFAATIEPKIIELPQNRIDLVYEIDEGPETGILDISFLGNTKFTDRELRQEIVTTESEWWKFFASQDNYDPDRITFDREQLRRFYLRNGYADFRVVSAIAELARDNAGFYVTFTLEEGDLYNFGDVSIESKVAELDPNEMSDLVKFSTGDTYNAELIEKTVEALTYYAGTRGYAFAEVRPRVKRDAKGHLINVVFVVEQGPRVYIERINIVGNTRTLDRVIRREFRLAEGDAYNKVLVDRSKSRVQGLGYFKNVEIAEEQGSAPDKTILNVNLEETTTGELQFGVGYSSQEGVIGDVSVSERNLLGRGQFLRLRASISNLRKQFDFRFTEPYFLDRNMAAGVDLYNITSTYDESSYEATTIGGGLRIGFPLSEFSRLGVRYALRKDDIKAFSDATDFIKALEGDFLTSVIGMDYVYDNRDNPSKPMNGYVIQVSGDFAGVGGDVKYYRGEAEATWYKRLWSDDFILSVGGDVGYIATWDKDTPLRLNDRFFKGGPSFRGFETAGVGPRQTVTTVTTKISDNSVIGTSTGDDSIGAEAYAIGTVELTVPNYLPDDLGIDTSLFVDFGTVGLVDGAGGCSVTVTDNHVDAIPPSTSDPDGTAAQAATNRFTTTSCIEDNLAFRASAGISVFWDSPFGRVRLDFSKVFAKEDYDKTEAFRFSAGTQF
ncbi:MAG: outer membrane protein assembly factor BamA [Alphaproteobacteria bacterium]|nr:outer membrane protein assembly factor BamA [Alphaproteobacteria bacterium]